MPSENDSTGLETVEKNKIAWTREKIRGGEEWDWSWEEWSPHLSKCLSDLKQNGTQKKTPVSGIVFNRLSHSLLSFAASGSSKNHPLTC